MIIEWIIAAAISFSTTGGTFLYYKEEEAQVRAYEVSFEREVPLEKLKKCVGLTGGIPYVRMIYVKESSWYTCGKENGDY